MLLRFALAGVSYSPIVEFGLSSCVPRTQRFLSELLMGFEPVTSSLPRNALYQLSYSSVLQCRLRHSPVGNTARVRLIQVVTVCCIFNCLL